MQGSLCLPEMTGRWMVNKIKNNAVDIGFFIAYPKARAKLVRLFRTLPRCGRLPLSNAYGIYVRTIGRKPQK